MQLLTVRLFNLWRQHTDISNKLVTCFTLTMLIFFFPNQGYLSFPLLEWKYEEFDWPEIRWEGGGMREKSVTVHRGTNFPTWLSGKGRMPKWTHPLPMCPFNHAYMKMVKQICQNCLTKHPDLIWLQGESNPPVINMTCKLYKHVNWDVGFDLSDMRHPVFIYFIMR